MREVDPRSRVEVISRDECLVLLADACVGRLAFSANGFPDVLPVNYVLDGDAIVFATADGSKLAACMRGRVAFEVDSTDEGTRSGWSVVVHGEADVVTAAHNPVLLTRLHSLPLNPWADGERPHLVRITPNSITGRRIRTLHGAA
jgi:nitroimidazol reductase NimA-like FMN-containing flavoprotein (pyridoxamine 5'-phosphate oxidase superfamily)